MIRDQCAYCGRTGNRARLPGFRFQVNQLWRKWVSHRSRFDQRLLLNTIRMIAYRAEPRMMQPRITGSGKGRSVRKPIQARLAAGTDVIPEFENGVRQVRIVEPAGEACERNLAPLNDEFNQTRTRYFGTGRKHSLYECGPPKGFTRPAQFCLFRNKSALRKHFCDSCGTGTDRSDHPLRIRRLPTRPTHILLPPSPSHRGAAGGAARRTPAVDDGVRRPIGPKADAARRRYPLKVQRVHHGRPWTASCTLPLARRAGGFWPWAVLTTRNPLLSFRFSGEFLSRFAERRFLGLLFHEPPRSTRADHEPARLPVHPCGAAGWPERRVAAGFREPPPKSARRSRRVFVWRACASQ